MGRTKIIGRKNTSVNLTEDQIAWVHANGYEMSQLLRDLIDEFMEKSMSSEEVLKKKKLELLEQQKRLLEEISVIDTQLGKREEKKTVVDQVIQEEEELEARRSEVVIAGKKNMKPGSVVNVLWLDHLKEAYKFENRSEVRKYILKKWTEAGADETRVRRFLQIT